MSEPKALEDSPFFKQTELQRPENIAEWPTVSLFVMAKNAESCIGRLLENLVSPSGLPYISDVAMVLNDTTDETEDIVEEFCEAHNMPCNIAEFTQRENPDAYIQDTYSTYASGKPLAGEIFAGPFTELPLLADWSAARNSLWTMPGACRGQWRLFLDADDVILDPESLPGLCLLLEKHKVDQAATRYLFDMTSDGKVRGSSFRERLTRNTQSIRWIYPIHEVLAGALKTAHIDGNLTVVDKRDNKGAGIRVPGRNFKVLYHLARRADWVVSPRILVNLIMEARLIVGERGIGREFVLALLELYLANSTWAEERAWAMAMVGEVEEQFEDYVSAKRLYENALGEHPSSKTAFRLCRANFMLGDYAGAVEAYDMGMESKGVHQALDEGGLYEDSSKIFVAAALGELGQGERAKEVCRMAMVAFPRSEALRDLGEKLGV